MDNELEGINIERRGDYTFLKYSDGLTMKWDDSMVIYVMIDPSYVEKTSGICGNFNQNATGNNRINTICLFPFHVYFF